MVLGQVDIHMYQCEAGPLPHTVYKAELKINFSFKYKS